MFLAVTSVGPPRITTSPGGTQTLAASAVVDRAEYASLWGDASLKRLSTASLIDVAGTIVAAEPLRTGPLCYTIGSTGLYVINWTPIKYTVRTGAGQLCTVTVGVPPGGVAGAVPALLHTSLQPIHIDPVCVDLPNQLEVTCNGCFEQLPLRLGQQCPRCIMTDSPGLYAAQPRPPKPW